MIGAMVLSLGLFSGPYMVGFSAYDSHADYLYKRTAWVFIGPAEKADGYPEPPAVEIRDVQIEIHLITTLEGETCSLTPTSIHEYGGNFIFGCNLAHYGGQ